ncbi:NAD(P)-binding protein [Penicillium herquei]|nr:NAD(P)-binding protein [Penicillium herquei]
MVKIAIAGGAGGVGQEIVDALVATKKHEIILLSRRDAPSDTGSIPEGTTWIKVDYTSVEQLTQVLQGVHTVLSFVTESTGEGSPVQFNLIDASVNAGVKRFAPSEWASSGFTHMSWYAFKEVTRQYLKDLNKDKKVLEYTLFHPGYFVNYLTCPYPSMKYIPFAELPWDLNNRRWIGVEGGENARISLTTVNDLRNVVVQAIEFEGEWPVDGGVRGDDISMGEFLAIAEKVRGMYIPPYENNRDWLNTDSYSMLGGQPFAVENLKAEEFESGAWTTSWTPAFDHPSIPVEQHATMAKVITGGMLLAVNANQLHVSDSWNKLLPDYKFTSVDDFLTEAWSGKP